VKLIGISGISGSGKTYLVKSIQEIIGKEHVSTLSFDDYYKPIHYQIKDANGRINFDHPQGVDHNKLIQDVDTLRKGESVEIEQYDFNNASATPTTLKIEPKPILLIEGIFLFHFTEIRQQLDYKIYIESDIQTPYERRKNRDSKERGISIEEIDYQWHHHVLPAFKTYLAPYKKEADILLRNDGKFESEQLAIIHKKILSLNL
jgi:uridine kinase